MKRPPSETGERAPVLSNPDKIMYPSRGFTKAAMTAYYRDVSPWMLEHLAGRAVTMVRFPDGVEGEFFFEKRCPAHRPEWMATAEVSHGVDKKLTACLINDRAALLWAANLAAIELHVPLARADAPQTPDFAVFDLDPGEGVDVLDCARVALIVRDLLEKLGLVSRVKTSGRKGLHVFVPINRTDATFEETRTFVRAAANVLQSNYGKLVTAKMRKDLRRGKVFVNWEQNDGAKTMVCAYSLRAGNTPLVSFPMGWDEVEKLLAEGRREGFALSPEDALVRLGEFGDAFAGLSTISQKLPGF